MARSGSRHDQEVVGVGHYVGLGISHPCTTFDKWRVIPVVDDAYNVANVVTTRF